MSSKSILFWLCLVALTPIAASILAVPPDELPAPVWDSCGDWQLYVPTCVDSAVFEFKAVIPGRENARGLIRYRLLRGPGELDEKTGHWVWYPRPADTAIMYDFAVEAYIKHTDITTESPCAPILRYRNTLPRLFWNDAPLDRSFPMVVDVDAPGMVTAHLRVTDPDWCDESSVTLIGVTPPPAATPLLDESLDFTLPLTASDNGKKFTARFQVASGRDTLEYAVVLETRRNVVPRFVECPDSMVVPVCTQPRTRVRAVDPDFPDDPTGITYALVREPNQRRIAWLDRATGEITILAMEPTAGSETEVAIAARYGDDITSPDDYCRFHVSVDERGPLQFVRGPCGDTLAARVNTVLRTQVTARSDDSCDQDIEYFFDGISPPPMSGHYSFNPTNGSFRLGLADADAGQLYSVRIGALNSYDTAYCEFAVQVGDATPLRVEIQGPADSVEQGTFVDVDVAITQGAQHLNGFDLLMQYDPATISFQQATPGDLYNSCAWEYFIYRYTGNVDCGGQPCPSGTIHVVGIGETNNGAQHPTCYDLEKPYKLFTMNFLVSNDQTFDCQSVPIRFVWYDCGDNAMSIHPAGDPDPYAQQLVISREVTDWSSVGGSELTDFNAAFPTLGGAPDTCLTLGQDRPVRMIDFVNGGVSIECALPEPPRVQLRIGKTVIDNPDCYYDQTPIPAAVDVTVDSLNTSIRGFDLLFGYDATALQFTQATPGPVFESCSWEYFTYRYGANGNCDGGCPSGMVQVVGITEINNGDVHPSCYNQPTPFVLFTLHFNVSSDPAYRCMFFPIRFFWTDCGDNAMSVFPAPNGDPYIETLILSDKVYDIDSEVDISDTTASLPTYTGAPSQCFEGATRRPLRGIDFTNGGIDRVCDDSIGCRGDINANGIANEIADNVLFGRYFVYGDSVLTDSIRQYQAAASDVNADGIPFGVADYVYQRRIIVGDALPYPHTALDTVTFSRIDGAFFLASQVDLGAIWVQVPGETISGSLSDDYEVASDYHDGYTSILIQPKQLTGAITVGEVFGITSFEQNITIEAAKYDGTPVVAIVQIASDVTEIDSPLPKEFRVAQNFPNPFNLETTISFGLPRAASVELEIYNVLGKLVYRYNNRFAAGNHEISWDGRNSSGQVVASGIYYYRITAGDQSQTKKMLLLK